MTYSRKFSWIIYTMISTIILSMLTLGVNAQSNAGAGFSGKVVSVNAAGNSFQAQVVVVYAGGRGPGGAGGIAAILPAGKIVTINVPAGTQLVNLKNQPITLAQVQSGMYFNAGVLVDTTTKSVTAQKIVIGSKFPLPRGVSAPSGTTGTTTTGTTATTTTTTQDTTTTTTTDSGTGTRTDSGTGTRTGVVGFAGQVVSVDPVNNKATVTVRVVYGGVRGRGALGAIIPGRTVTMDVPPTAVIKRQGQVIALTEVQPSDLFNANVIVQGNVVTAQNIQVVSSGQFKVLGVQGLGKHAITILTNTLNTFGRIIVELDTQIQNLKANGTNTSVAEAQLNQCIVLHANATALLDATNLLYAAIEASSTKDQASKDFKVSLIATVEATKDTHKCLRRAAELVKSLQ